ncbi:MAG: ribonuclease H-like domain-containing protein, partial [Deltaproteobacteria bacterium]|nr:ribonuclease H-like domain-containing protein [Deltaproteobacteria bacterium]
RETVVLPLPSYSIKDVARYKEVGFDWRDEEASAAMSYVWYNNYLKDGNEKWLEKIKIYNEDDLFATYKVKEWLSSL